MLRNELKYFFDGVKYGSKFHYRFFKKTLRDFDERHEPFQYMSEGETKTWAVGATISIAAHGLLVGATIGYAIVYLTKLFS